MNDLRSFLDRIKKERKSDFLEIHRQVDPRHETAAILVKLEEKSRSPILWFHDVRGSKFPLVSNVCGSLGRLALALDCSLRDVTARYAEAISAPIDPRRLDGPAPVHQNVLRGDEVDLGLLPQLVYHEGDAEQPYLTAAIAVARDPDTGRSNLSYHRMMITSRNTTGIFMEKGKHLDAIFQKYRARGEAMPVAVYFGVHPLVSLGALYSGPEEEYRIIGALQKSPLELADCVSQPGLQVPAFAELVLEGFVPPEERMTEGPFGEFTGYGTGQIETPVFHCTAQCFRDEMVFQDIVSGHMEHLILSVPAIETRTLKDAQRAAPGVTKVALVAPLTAIVALEKTDDQEPRRIIDALLKADIYSKHVIVVDADVDPGDTRQVLAAMALCTQAATDVVIYPDEQGTPLDPSSPTSDGRGAKMGIDATRRLKPARNVTRNRIPQAILDRIDLGEILGKK